MTPSLPDQQEIVLNGLNGENGQYLMPPMSPEKIARLALGEQMNPNEASDLKIKKNSLEKHLGVEADARKLDKTGWGVVLPGEIDPQVVEALQPLLAHRQAQAGEYFRIFSGADGVQLDESKAAWLERHGMGPGPANPKKVPYYLLLVGSASQISFRFQQQLDIQYAVGRLHFDTPEEYATYAASVVLVESGQPLPARAAFFGVANEDDRATQLSADQLVIPLAEKLKQIQVDWQAGSGGVERPAWEVQTILKEQATKQSLSDLLNGSQAPALFFSASHGIAFPAGSTRQDRDQGALVCQDWQGPLLHTGPIAETDYFSASDLSSTANLAGTIAFLFACYGAGTPRYDEFAGLAWKDQAEIIEIARQDFVSRLPQRMLGLPRGGALAVVGHVDRAWGASFIWGSAGSQLQVFEDFLTRLMQGGYPIGYALEVFNNRYAEISSEFSEELTQIKKFFKKVNHLKVSTLWTANNDARNYILLGDPAVRLSVSGATQAQRPELTAKGITTSVKTPSFNANSPPKHPPIMEVKPEPPTPREQKPLFQILSSVLLRDTEQNLEHIITLQPGTGAPLEITTCTGRIIGSSRLPMLVSVIHSDGRISQETSNGDVDEAARQRHAALVTWASSKHAEIVESLAATWHVFVNMNGDLS